MVARSHKISLFLSQCRKIVSDRSSFSTFSRREDQRFYRKLSSPWRANCDLYSFWIFSYLFPWLFSRFYDMYIELQDVTTMTYVDNDICSWRHVSIPRYNQIGRYMYRLTYQVDNFRFCFEFFMGRVRKWCGFSRGPRTHHRGCLASFEFRMAAWRTPSRGVDWTAPHPAINKLAEREQPRDEPFNSATFCLPSPFYIFSSPSRDRFLSTFLPLSACSLFFSRNPCYQRFSTCTSTPFRNEIALLRSAADYRGPTNAKETPGFLEFSSRFWSSVLVEHRYCGESKSCRKYFVVFHIKHYFILILNYKEQLEQRITILLMVGLKLNFVNVLEITRIKYPRDVLSFAMWLVIVI